MNSLKLHGINLVPLFLIVSTLPSFISNVNLPETGDELPEEDLPSAITTTTFRPRAYDDNAEISPLNNITPVEASCSPSCIAGTFFGILGLLSLCFWIGTVMYQRNRHSGVFSLPSRTTPRFEEIESKCESESCSILEK